MDLDDEEERKRLEKRENELSKIFLDVYRLFNVRKNVDGK